MDPVASARPDLGAAFPADLTTARTSQRPGAAFMAGLCRRHRRLTRAPADSGSAGTGLTCTFVGHGRVMGAVGHPDIRRFREVVRWTR